MNNELKDPLEKVSNSLRRAVSINKSKETDLRTTMNTIQRERRRSFNTWSLKQEKFLRAKQSLVPAMLFGQDPQMKRTKIDDSKDNKTRQRRITLVRAVDPVSLAAANRSNSPDNKLPSITTHKNDGRRKKKNKSEVLPPVITLANSSQFIQENKRLRRTSDHRQPLSSFTSETSSRELPQHYTYDERVHSDIASFPSGKKRHLPQSVNQSSLQPKKTPRVVTKEETIQPEPMPGITEERSTSSQASERSLTPMNTDLLPAISTTDKEERNERAKGQWTKVRQSLEQTTDKKQRTDINKFSMMELTKLFEEIRECRYLRVGNQSNFASEPTNHRNVTCKCLACTIKDKNKLKNHLSAPD